MNPKKDFDLSFVNSVDESSGFFNRFDTEILLPMKSLDLVEKHHSSL